MINRIARPLFFLTLLLLAAAPMPRSAQAGVDTAAQFVAEFKAICIDNIDQPAKVQSMAAAQSWQIVGKNMAILPPPTEKGALYKAWRKHEPDGTYILIGIAEYSQKGKSSQACLVAAINLIYDRALESLLMTMKLKEIHDTVIGDSHIHEWTMETPGGLVTIDYETPQGEKRGPAKLYLYTTPK